jgi:hypothetical protein
MRERALFRVTRALQARWDRVILARVLLMGSAAIAPLHSSGRRNEAPRLLLEVDVL